MNILFDNLLLIPPRKSKGNLSHLTRKEIMKTINPIGWRDSIYPKKLYLDCASIISIALELLDNYSR